MNKFLSVIIFGLLISSNVNAASKWGKGELQLDDYVVEKFIEYLRVKPPGTPSRFAVSRGYQYYYCPQGSDCGAGGSGQILEECSKYLNAKYVAPNDNIINSNSFDIIFDSVGLEVSRQQAIEVVSPGGSIIHIGLTQPAGTFNFRKLTLQEITLVGTYCYTNKDFQQTINLLHKKTLGPLNWIEYRELKNGANAFKEIHDGTCVAPKIILIP